VRGCLSRQPEPNPGTPARVGPKQDRPATAACGGCQRWLWQPAGHRGMRQNPQSQPDNRSYLRRLNHKSAVPGTATPGTRTTRGPVAPAHPEGSRGTQQHPQAARPPSYGAAHSTLAAHNPRGSGGTPRGTTPRTRFPPGSPPHPPSCPIPRPKGRCAPVRPRGTAPARVTAEIRHAGRNRASGTLVRYMPWTVAQHLLSR